MVMHNTYGYTITVVWFIVLTLYILKVLCHKYISTWSKSAVYIFQAEIISKMLYIIKLLSWTIWKHVWLHICMYGYFHVSNSHYRHGNTPNLILQTVRYVYFCNKKYTRKFLTNINIYALCLYFYQNTYGYAISTPTWFWLSLSDLVVSFLAIFIIFVLVKERNTRGHFACIFFETVLHFYFSFWQFFIWNTYGYIILHNYFLLILDRWNICERGVKKNKWDVLGYSNSWRLLLVNIFAKKLEKNILGGNILYFFSNNDQKTRFWPLKSIIFNTGI